MGIVVGSVSRVRRWLQASRFIARLGIVIFATAIVAVSLGTAADAAGTGRSGSSDLVPKSVDAYITFYGWFDNTPPGCATAYSGCAGGTGTYQHPITFASDKQELPVGTVVYYPTLEKYFVMGDECQECQSDWTGKGPDGGPHLYHLDLWAGGKGGNEFDLINCEDALTQGMPDGAPLLTPLVLNPPADLPVSTEPIFNSATNKCFGGAQTLTSYGRYRNPATGKCLADQGDSDKAGTPAVLAPCNTGASEDLAFDGAFLTVNGNKLCLQTMGSIYGSRLEFALCTGGPKQQWEINTNGTIAWIQYLRCLTDVKGTVEFGHCAARPANQWSFSSEAPLAPAH